MEQRLDFNLLAIFARVAESGSFTAAAASLRVPKSTISRSVRRLEEEVKAPLLLRSTRHVELTALGRRLVAACASDFAALDARLQAVLSDTQQPSRLVRLTAVEDMGASLLPEVVARFAKRYPQVRFELMLTNDQLNLIREGVDLAIRVGRLPQTSYRKRHLGSVTFVFVASARYCERFGAIGVGELAQHPLLALPSWSLTGKGLRLVNGPRETHLVTTAKVLTTNTTALLKMVHLDLGIALLPDFVCRESLAQGALQQVCPGWHTPAKSVSLLYTAHTPREPVIKELGDSVYEHLRRSLWTP
jgi:DNA-binding transcriptional LysR family regulator